MVLQFFAEIQSSEAHLAHLPLRSDHGKSSGGFVGAFATQRTYHLAPAWTSHTWLWSLWWFTFITCTHCNVWELYSNYLSELTIFNTKVLEKCQSDHLFAFLNFHDSSVRVFFSALSKQNSSDPTFWKSWNSLDRSRIVSFHLCHKCRRA